MKYIYARSSCVTIVMTLVGMFWLNCARGQDKWDRLVNLEGKWKFNIGDKLAWAGTTYDDTKWEEIYVPSKWEDEGFNGYNGYAWYRTSFNGSALGQKGQGVNLFLGYIDDVDEVYVNGQKVGGSGSFPPKYHTSYDAFRNYYLQPSILNYTGMNVIAVRVYDAGIEGGIVSGDVGIYVNRSESGLSINLRGMWDFRLTKGMYMKKGDQDLKLLWDQESQNGNGWVQVPVPSYWENQGFPDYDGSVWYRKKFTVPKQFAAEDMVLLLGKIDDSDKTYLNGKLVGATIDRHDQLRIYFIKPGDFKVGENLLQIYVDDPQGAGGIYEGPVGLMRQSEFTRFMRWRY
jgi:hypothetical protein